MAMRQACFSCGLIQCIDVENEQGLGWAALNEGNLEHVCLWVLACQNAPSYVSSTEAPKLRPLIEGDTP